MNERLLLYRGIRHEQFTSFRFSFAFGSTLLLSVLRLKGAMAPGP
jgi:hypothetical protein